MDKETSLEKIGDLAMIRVGVNIQILLGYIHRTSSCFTQLNLVKINTFLTITFFVSYFKVVKYIL